jgi:Flp pilus assembly pilin Flp
MPFSRFRFIRLAEDRSAITAIEYAAMASVLVVAIASGANLVATRLSAVFDTVSALF